MLTYRTSEGDRILVDQSEAGLFFDDDVLVSVNPGRGRGRMRSETHEEALAELHRRERYVRILIRPAGSEGTVRYDALVAGREDGGGAWRLELL